jgi:hypothetical protein
MLPADELRKRVKAARALAGFGSTKELARAIGPDGKLGDRKLRTLEGESAPRPFREPELEQIAKACSVSMAFFTVDFAVLGGEEPSVQERLEQITAQLTTMSETVSSDLEPAIRRLELWRRRVDAGQAPPGTQRKGNRGQSRRRRADG